MLRKLGKSYQIAIPKKIVDTLDLKQNDYLEVYVENDKIILEPKVVIPKDRAYFYTEEWQKEEKEAGEDIKSGRVTETKNLDKLFSNPRYA